ncbi:MAG: DUF6498-containing protein [Gammaproteobacteria bacterium]
MNDRTIGPLVASNSLALVVAAYESWSLIDLLVVYWAQNVVIGIANIARILKLERFSTAGFMMNNEPVSATPTGRRQVAWFFAGHYGTFHAFYFFFLFQAGAGATLSTSWLWLCAAGFAVNHWFSFRQHCAHDLAGRPNIGSLMATPYLRVVPMHIMVIVGGLLMDSLAGLLIFGALKTVADVAMHAVEHRRYQKHLDPDRLP